MSFDGPIDASQALRTRGGRPTRARSGEITDAMLSAAMSEFAERGYHGASIASIADRAGVTRATIYKNFGHKQTLLERVAEIQAERLRVALGNAIDTHRPSVDVLMDVGLCFHAEGRSHTSRVLARVFVMEAERMPNLLASWRELRWRALQPIIDYFQELSRRGEIDVEDIVRAAEQFLHLTTSSLDFLIAEDVPAIAGAKLWVQSAVRIFLFGVRPVTARDNPPS